MKIFQIGIFRYEPNKPDGKKAAGTELCCQQDLSSFNYFTKTEASKFMSVLAGEVAGRTPTERGLQNQTVEEEGYTFHAYGRPEGVCFVVISDHEYPTTVAHGLLMKVADEFLVKYPRTTWASIQKTPPGQPPLSFPELKSYIVKYQNPEEADNIMKIQKELDETKITLHKTLESVLERGEKLDDLVAKSDGLSAQSKMFYTQAKKQNSCCVVM